MEWQGAELETLYRPSKEPVNRHNGHLSPGKIIAEFEPKLKLVNCWYNVFCRIHRRITAHSVIHPLESFLKQS